MADLSSYSPIYIRSNGDDTSGDGTLSNPYLTAQKAFEIAYAEESNYVLDFGSGNFGGVNLNTANASEWPSRIAVIGINSSSSLLGGINGNGQNAILDEDNNLLTGPTNGSSITILSDNNINLGHITNNGGDYPNETGATGGNITLTNVDAENLSSNGGNGDNAGNTAGNIILLNCNCKNINANGGGGSAGGAGGDITLYGTSALIIGANGNGSAYGNDSGHIILNRSRAQSVYCNASIGENQTGISYDVHINDSEVFYVSAANTVLVGFSMIKDRIDGNLDATNCYRRSGINGCGLLGVL